MPRDSRTPDEPREVPHARALLRLDRQGSAALPLHEQVYRQLRGRIESGALAGGSRLPAARVVAAELGMARNTVDAALLRLQQDGFVVRRAGAGSVVTDGMATLRDAAAEIRFVRVHRDADLALKVYGIASPEAPVTDDVIEAALSAVLRTTSGVLHLGLARPMAQHMSATPASRTGVLIVQARRDRTLAMLDHWRDDALLDHAVWIRDRDGQDPFTPITAAALPLSPDAVTVLAHESQAWARYTTSMRGSPEFEAWASDTWPR